MGEITKEVPTEAIAAQLEKLCGSTIFKNSARLCRFLRYTVEAAVRGDGEVLKEYAIGVDVYDRRQSYHPSQDSIVRTEAKRLRNKLKEYYDTEGGEDEVLVYYRPGKYEPVFRRRFRVPEVLRSSAREISPPSQGTPPGVTIAVLPFRHQEGDAETVPIAAGITDDLIFRISSTDGCRVVAPHSLALLHAQISDVSLMNEVLKFDQIVTGSVRKEASRIRVSVTGVHPSGLETWSERFDVITNGSDLLELEEQTASAIMARIAPQESVLRHMKVKVPSVCLSTFPELLSAEASVDQGSSSSLRNALGKFQQLALRQPESPRIRCGITHCHYGLALLGEAVSPDDIQAAKEAATQALTLDPEMGEAHAAMACVHFMEHDPQSAETAFRHALTLKPSPTSFQGYAELLMSLGRFGEASVLLDESRKIDPFSCRQRVCDARLDYLQQKRQRGALERETQYGPVLNQVLLFEAESFLRNGQVADAIHLVELILRSSDQGAAGLSDVAAIFALAGHNGRANTLIDQFKLLDPQTTVSRTYQARLCMAVQDEGSCRSALKLAIAQSEPQLCWLEIDPKFQDLRFQV